MPFITFIYRIGNNKKVYYGKYVCDYISDDHEGLDSEIKPVIIRGLNQFRKQRGLPRLNQKVSIGILSFSSNNCIPIFATKAEIKCFDFYYISHTRTRGTYVNGKQIQ